MIYKDHLITNYDITHAIQNIRYGAVWSITGTDYKNLNWLDETQQKPTEEELNDEILRLQLAYDNREYQRLRANEYPSIVDQLDTLYHQGYDGWKELIEDIKLKYPKPSQ